MPLVIEYLHLESKTRISGFNHLFCDEVFDPAVATGTETPFHSKVKVAVLANRNDVAAVLALLATSSHVLDRTVFNRPANIRHLVATESAPSIPGLPVEKQLPSGCFLSSG